MEDVADERMVVNELGNDKINDLLSRCANCHLEFSNMAVAISEIRGKYPTIVEGSRHNYTRINENVTLPHSSGTDPIEKHEINECQRDTQKNCILISQQKGDTDYPVTVLEAVSTVFGFPLERRQNLEDEWMWKKEDYCVLCEQCAKIVTVFYQAYQELVALAHEASYISIGLEQLRNCLKKNFFDDNKAEISKRAKERSKIKKPHSRCTSGTNRAISNSLHEIPSKEPLKNVKSKLEKQMQQSKENNKSNELRLQDNDDSQIEMKIVKVETILPEQFEKDANMKNKKVELSCSLPEDTGVGTREIVTADGRIIRSSTRTRKLKAPVDFGGTCSSNRKSLMNTSKQRRGTRREENIQQQQSSMETSSANVNDVDSLLWEFCSDLYYKDTNLATLKDGRFICPDAKCGKTFKGLKTLNKHSLVHDLNRSYHCSKCDKEFKSRGQIRLHVQQCHIDAANVNTHTNVSSNPNKTFEKCSLYSNQSNTQKFDSSKQLRRKDEKTLNEKPTKEKKTPPKFEKQYHCEHCDKIYVSKHMYEKHLASHDKQCVMCRCTVCDQKFHTALSLARHITSVHDDNDESILLDYSCLQCPLSVSSFENYNELKAHFEKTHKKSLNFCKKCGKSFITSLYLRRHYQNIHNEQWTETDGENQSALNKDELSVLNEDSEETILHDSFDKDLEPGEVTRKNPKSNSNSNANSLFNCTKCSKKFKRKHQLNLHILFHNETVPRFGCSKCPKMFFQPNSLRTHMLVHSMENPLLCKKCDKVFERRDHFKRHMEVVHTKDRLKRTTNPGHSCSECKKTFSRKEYLRLHMRIHTGERPHVCDVCGKQFRDPRNLAQHLVTHKTERPFCCSVCGLTFKRAHHLNDHEGTHRQNIARPFVCPVADCGKAFKLKKHLVSHELVHLGSKDHICHVCGRAFSRKDNLQQHVVKIHGKKLADELLVVVEEQRQRYRRQTQHEQQQKSSHVDNEATILEQDSSLLDTTALVSSASFGQETANLIENLIPENNQVPQFLQIFPTDVKMW